MDIGRGILLNNCPRHRLDAGRPDFFSSSFFFQFFLKAMCEV